MASITLQSASVDFPIYNLHARSLKKHFISLTTGGILLNQQTKCVVVRALDKITFQLSHGDRVALIGRNGAGKSTLLRVLAKIYEPNEGSIHFEGKISPLLDFMLGLNPESTGYENIILRGLLLGLSRKEIMAKMDEIAVFTELGDYLSVPIRTYSSGMQLRLAFGVATSINPEILLMDEIIGVGDASFMAKAEKRLNELVEQSSIVVLATHSEPVIKKMCNKAILLESGKVKYVGSVEEAFAIYNNVNSSSAEQVAAAAV
jgi:ABC-2 type transport system ATP-binding protein/lipopolysaccharide transport system ATP-binding protein